MKTDSAFAGLAHEAETRAAWHRTLRRRPTNPAPRADWPEWVRFAIFYVAVFVVLGGWVSALRTLADILRGVLQ